eukprot:CAMPEP_0119042634 /NCGR_PEP_ID=MMETSP1177-20130426/16041_1 /TAXON_ID=2985 /ORGANISM="Ochromonas sp, Strain CCMP1899" /LENGTH=432 /DNA_ID=CAMNT_0007009563 /DNA_START=108 /DNA_END=1403 /DNA_ORIENTATION=-
MAGSTLAVLLLLFTVSEGYTNIGFKSRYVSSLKVSTLPSNEAKPTVLSRITGASRFFLQDQTRSRYAAAMALRFSYFLGQGIFMSTSSSQGKNTGAGLKGESVIGALVDAITSDEIMTENSFMVSNKAVNTDAGFDAQDLFSKNFVAIINLLKKDLKNVENGVYKFPYDLDPRQMPSQYGIRSVLGQFQAYRDNQVDVIERRSRKGGRDVTANYQSKKYPDYYLQNFHYQTDGWLSALSASLYDYQVESLFLGTADAMRRQILPSISDFMKGKQASKVKHLDIACGTGRFISFVLDNYNDLDCTVLDLSPFYLADTKKLLKKYNQVKYVEAPAEALPFEDASLDSISCVYLFHELPSEIRVKVVAEMARVLKPGGEVFFVDSAQAGEVPFEAVLEGFTVSAHEPYYMDYTKTDLPALFKSSGMSVKTNTVNW